MVDLPSNSLIDMETLVLRAKISTTTSAGLAWLPKHIESIIDKVVIEVNGATLGSCASLNHVYNLLLQYQNGADLKTKRKVYQEGEGTNVEPSANITDQEIAIHQLLGFCTSVQPSCLDSAILGSIKLHIYLAPATVLPVDSSAATVSYTLDNVYFMVDTIDISDNLFYSLHNQFLLSGGVYEYPFTSIYTAMFSASSYTQSSRFSVNTQSLDMLAACFLPYHGQSKGLNSNTWTSDYFTKNGMGVDSWQFEVGGVSIPQFSASGSDTLPIALNSLCLSQDTMGSFDSLIDSDTAYRSNFFAPIVRTNHPTDSTERFISGINTLGANTNVVFKTTGSGTATYSGSLLVCAFCTSSLRVSAGRSIQVIS